MINEIDIDERNGLESLIKAGLEYGDNDRDGKMDNKQIDDEFPIIFKILNKYTDSQ